MRTRPRAQCDARSACVHQHSFESIRMRVERHRRRGGNRAAAQTRSERAIVENSRQRSGHRTKSTGRWHEHAIDVVVKPLAHAARVKCNRRNTPCGSLEADQTKRLRPETGNGKYCGLRQCRESPRGVEPPWKFGGDTLTASDSLPFNALRAIS